MGKGWESVMNAAIFERNYLPSRIKAGTATDLYRLGLKFQENPQFDEYFAAVCADSLMTAGIVTGKQIGRAHV